MKLNYRLIGYLGISATLFVGCGATADIITTPIENIDTSPLKITELTEAEKHNWGHLDLQLDTIPGMAIDRAYAEIIKGKKGKKVIVAVIDSGIDIDHEDLDGVIWTNKGEIPNNGKDDDNNGYIDDINGWNFLGDAYDEQLEYVRLLASGDTSNPRFEEAKALLEKETQETLQTKQNIDGLLQQIIPAKAALKKHFEKEDYTKEDVIKIKSDVEALNQAKNVQLFLYDRGLTLEDVTEYATQFAERLNTNLNKDFSGRKTGDDINNISDTGYGNGNVKPVKKSESHGTHVAGIIAAERNNGKGANGVANNVEIMSIRAVPNGDEYDKDIALFVML